MPQMNPIWWFTLFIFFIIHLIFTNPMNYFFFQPSISQNTKKNLHKSSSWKW